MRSRVRWEKHSDGYYVAVINARQPRRRLVAWDNGTWSLWEDSTDVARGFTDKPLLSHGQRAATKTAKKRGWIS